MSVFSGPNISNSGLVFAYDMSNTDKSWKGAPVTNLNTEQSLSGMSGISLTFVGIENGWKKYGISGTWASGTYPFSLNISATTLSGTVAYSAQAIIKTNVISKFLTFGGLNYVNDGSMVNSGVSTVTSIGNDTDGLGMVLSKREGFIYSAGFANPTTSQLGYINSRPTADGVSFNSSTDFVWIKNIQVEQGTFCTPWVQVARSNTQALLDQTNQSTITASNVTYSSSNTFSFVGGTQRMDIGNTIGPISNNFTIAAWINSTDITATQNILSMNGPYFMRISNSRVRFNVLAGGTWLFQDGTTPLSSNTWYYFTMVYNFAASLWIGYINGVQEFSVAKSGTIASTTFYGYVGYTPEGGEQSNFFGQIAAVQYYNRALTPTEVKQNFNALRSRYGI
jgi:hypothetical protein